MDTKQIKKIRNAVTRAKRAGGRRARYSAFVKESARACLREGHSPQELSNMTGIGLSTLFGWSQAPDDSKFRKVEVVDEGQPQIPLMIVLPNGVRVECASVDLLKKIVGWFK